MATPQEDLDALLEHLLGFATEELSTHGDYHPFAAAIGEEGEPRVVSVDPGENDPEPGKVVDLLAEALAAQAAAGEIRASGICVHVTLGSEDSDETTDAALVQLEHRDDDPVEVALPYELHGDHIHEGELVAAPGKPRVFPKS